MKPLRDSSTGMIAVFLPVNVLSIQNSNDFGASLPVCLVMPPAEKKVGKDAARIRGGSEVPAASVDVG
jgi:hypothetical protein